MNYRKVCSNMAANLCRSTLLCPSRRMLNRLVTIAIGALVIFGTNKAACALDAGTAQAMVGLGVLYEGGKGVPQSYKKAAELYQKAALSGNAAGEAFLASLYMRGLGVSKDYGR